jgi:hypothetical protein
MPRQTKTKLPVSLIWNGGRAKLLPQPSRPASASAAAPPQPSFLSCSSPQNSLWHGYHPPLWGQRGKGRRDNSSALDPNRRRLSADKWMNNSACSQQKQRQKQKRRQKQRRQNVPSAFIPLPPLASPVISPAPVPLVHSQHIFPSLPIMSICWLYISRLFAVFDHLPSAHMGQQI